ncbi:MAG: hypothetical protein ABEJ72_10405, partial [Candidatus Aenigmatarchaeota archaeon]
MAELFHIGYDTLSKQDFKWITDTLQSDAGTPEEITDPGNDVEERLDELRSTKGGSNLIRYNTAEGDVYALEGYDGFFL